MRHFKEAHVLSVHRQNLHSQASDCGCLFSPLNVLHPTPNEGSHGLGYCQPPFYVLPPAKVPSLPSLYVYSPFFIYDLPESSLNPVELSPHGMWLPHLCSCTHLDEAPKVSLKGQLSLRS